MNCRSFCLIIVVSFLSSFSFNALADTSLEDLVRARMTNAHGAAENSQSTADIPGYSEKEKDAIELEMNAIAVDVKSEIDNLQIEGTQRRNREANKNPDGVMATMVKATSKSRVTGKKCQEGEDCTSYDDLKIFSDEYAKQEIFTDADKYMQDPVSQMSLVTSQECQETVNNQQQGFIKQENSETYTNEIEELRICEEATAKFKCNKVLSVHCKKTIQCDYGGITKVSIPKNMIFDTSNGFITMGTDADNNFKGTCATFEETATFEIAQASLVTVFRLVHVKFDDYLQLELNGHIFYVGPDGGEYVEVKEEEVEKERTVTTDLLGQKLAVPRVEKYKEKTGRTMVFNGEGKEPQKCERDTDWNSEKNIPRVNIDLKPYLKNGINVLKMKIIVSGLGEGWFKIEAKQQCCASDGIDDGWIETEVETCE